MQPFFSDELEDLLDKLLRPSPRASVKEVLLRPWMKNATALRVGSMEQRRGSAPFLGLPNMPMISPGNVRDRYRTLKESGWEKQNMKDREQKEKEKDQ